MSCRGCGKLEKGYIFAGDYFPCGNRLVITVVRIVTSFRAAVRMSEPTMTMSDHDTSESGPAGYVTQVREIFDRYYRPLLCFAYEYVQDWDEARDIVHDLFLKFLEKNYMAGVAPDKIGSYLFSSVRYACRRHNPGWPPRPDRVGLDNLHLPAESVQDMDEEQVGRAARALEQLPERTRQAVEYVLVRGCPYKEAAEEMGISVNTVKYLLKEGVRKLRDGVARLSAGKPDPGK